MPQLKIYGPGAQVTVRSNRSAADASDWTPDNTAGGESGVVLDAREWEDVRVHADFLGSPGGSETVTLVPMASRRTSAGALVWYDLPEVTLAGDKANDLVLTDGMDVSFRITALTLDSAGGVDIIVTSGQRDRG